MDQLRPNDGEMMAETVTMVHATAVRLSEPVFSRINATSGGVREIDTRYWDASALRSFAVLQAGTVETRYVLTYLPGGSLKEAAYRRVAGFADDDMSGWAEGSGLYDSRVGTLGRFEDPLPVLPGTGLSDGDIYLVTDIISLRKGPDHDAD